MVTRNTDSPIQEWKPFGNLPVPAGIAILKIRSQAGWLTAMRAQPRRKSRGVALFVPGFTGSKEDFYPIFPSLAKMGWDVWAISQRGQADSAAPKGVDEYAREKTARDVVDVAREIEDETGADRIHLVGHSFGGTVAQAAVILDASPFCSLTLLDSGPCGWPGRHEDVISKIRKHPDSDLWSLDNSKLVSTPAGQLSADQNFFRIRSRATSRDQLLGALAQLGDVRDTSFQVLATGLSTCVIYGEDDKYSWPQDWLRREAKIMGSQVAVIPHAGHCPNQDNPGETCRQLDRFWTSLAN